MRLTLLGLFFTLIISGAYGQNIDQQTINIGGNTFKSAQYQFDWSIGEGSSINSFTSQNKLLITSGLLQPKYIPTFIVPYTGQSWTKEEVVIYPLPTKDFFDIKFELNSIGEINLKLIDQYGRPIQTRVLNYTLNSKPERFDISNLAPGIYYLTARMGLPFSPTKNGSFKIIKL
ncbi:T9SS type A sorting domain-containing protein [Pedobacter glucosidilyticus]|uniref:T9SS type A sorting domain-containing protein n=1 Tax=Pedobacter glucosidilyticus TaxID=1122941 RepID=UPI0026E9BB84|nr:T9SS type A sorting domain-containing protein [Pedobacter glucosidilyticus]